MAKSSIDLPVIMGVQAFNVQVMTAVGNPVNVQAAITIKATGPAGVVTLNSFQYSTDGGSTYNSCTLVNPPSNMEIPSSNVGQLTTIVWDAYTDIGYAALNNMILIRATITDGTHISPIAQGSVTITKKYKEVADPTKNGIKSNTAVGMSLSIKGKR